MDGNLVTIIVGGVILLLVMNQSTANASTLSNQSNSSTNALANLLKGLTSGSSKGSSGGSSGGSAGSAGNAGDNVQGGYPTSIKDAIADSLGGDQNTVTTTADTGDSSALIDSVPTPTYDVTTLFNGQDYSPDDGGDDDGGDDFDDGD